MEISVECARDRLEEIPMATIKPPGNTKPRSKKPERLLQKNKKSQSEQQLLNSYASRGDSVSPMEAKRSREKAEDVYEIEQMSQEPSFCKTILEARV